jgi:hypothetical protein
MVSSRLRRNRLPRAATAKRTHGCAPDVQRRLPKNSGGCGPRNLRRLGCSGTGEPMKSMSEVVDMTGIDEEDGPKDVQKTYSSKFLKT